MPHSPTTSHSGPTVRVEIYGLLRLMLDGLRELELPWQEGDTVRSLLERFQAAVAVPVRHKLVDGAGGLHLGTIIMVNRKNVLHLAGLETAVEKGDVLGLFPPGAGG